MPVNSPRIFWESLSQPELLARCLYGEARGETVRGKLAVAHVVLNRALEGGWYGADLRGVILKPRQFSCFNENDPNFQILSAPVIKDSGYPVCRSIAELATQGLTMDPTNGATHYHAISIFPGWASSMIRLTQIGSHVFYRAK